MSPDGSPGRKLIGADKSTSPFIFRTVEVDQRGRIMTSTSGFSYDFFYVADDALSGAVVASGATTEPVYTYEFSDKTFYWESEDSSGTFTVMVMNPISGWHTLRAITFASGTLVNYTMSGQAIAVQLTNTTSASGTIYAWYMMRNG